MADWRIIVQMTYRREDQAVGMRRVVLDIQRALSEVSRRYPGLVLTEIGFGDAEDVPEIQKFSEQRWGETRTE